MEELELIENLGKVSEHDMDILVKNLEYFVYDDVLKRCKSYDVDKRVVQYCSSEKKCLDVPLSFIQKHTKYLIQQEDKEDNIQGDISANISNSTTKLEQNGGLFSICEFLGEYFVNINLDEYVYTVGKI